VHRNDPAGDIESYDVSSADKTITPPGCLYIETTGPVEFVCAESGRTITVPGLLGGMVHPIKVKQVNAAGTTASTVYIWRNGR
jgi:hypothetical protein